MQNPKINRISRRISIQRTLKSYGYDSNATISASAEISAGYSPGLDKNVADEISQSLAEDASRIVNEDLERQAIQKIEILKSGKNTANPNMKKYSRRELLEFLKGHQGFVCGTCGHVFNCTCKRDFKVERVDWWNDPHGVQGDLIGVPMAYSGVEERDIYVAFGLDNSRYEFDPGKDNIKFICPRGHVTLRVDNALDEINATTNTFSMESEREDFMRRGGGDISRVLYGISPTTFSRICSGLGEKQRDFAKLLHSNADISWGDIRDKMNLPEDVLQSHMEVLTAKTLTVLRSDHPDLFPDQASTE